MISIFSFLFLLIYFITVKKFKILLAEHLSHISLEIQRRETDCHPKFMLKNIFKWPMYKEQPGKFPHSWPDTSLASPVIFLDLTGKADFF